MIIDALIIKLQGLAECIWFCVWITQARVYNHKIKGLFSFYFHFLFWIFSYFSRFCEGNNENKKILFFVFIFYFYYFLYKILKNIKKTENRKIKQKSNIFHFEKLYDFLFLLFSLQNFKKQKINWKQEN